MDGVPGYGHGVEGHAAAPGLETLGPVGAAAGTTDGPAATGVRSMERASSALDAVAYGSLVVGFCGAVGAAGLPRTRAGGGKKADELESGIKVLTS